MKYIVEIGYKDFIFEDKVEAISWAETAFVHSKAPETVKIIFKREEVAEDE